MKKIVKKIIHEKNDAIAKSYVDKVVYGSEGWKTRYYKEKFQIDLEDLPEFM